MRDNLNFKFSSEILEVVQSIQPQIEKIEFIVDRDIDNPANPNVVDCAKEYKDWSSKKRKDDTPGVTMVDGISTRTMSEKYRLDNFIVGPSNQLAYAACEAIVRAPGKHYNPAFVYGDVGVGKTHLLQAVGNSIKQKHKDLKVIYTTADRFLNDYTMSVKKRTVDKMREKYRNFDVLILDDAQYLAGKDSTQMELYNIFNLMYETGRQLILSGDRAPRELTQLEPRLRSRFEWGIIVDIEAPDFETRLAIIQEKAREREFILPQDVSEFIAYNTNSNVREIEGILNQIIAEYELYNRPPTIENVAARMNKLAFTDNILGNTKKIKSTIKNYEELLETVSAHFGIEKKALMSEDRKKENMIPRQVAMYLLKNKLNYTYERIGNIFSGRNHSAVLYSCKKLETIIKKDRNLFYEVNVIRDKLGL